MKISVIIPTFNRSNVLKRAIDSVFSQSYQDFELIVVDDASTDHTQEILSSYRDARLKVITLKENQGVSYARNRGFEASSGEWIALLDSDDEWKKEKLKVQVEYIQSEPHYPLVHCEEIWIRNEKRINQKKIHQKSGGDIFKRALHLCLISPSACMMRRDIWKELGGFREDFEVCEDYDLWLKLTSRYEIGFISDPLIIKYGGHEDQLSQKYKAMDFWRVKAIDDLIQNDELSIDQRNEAQEVLLKKANILKNGYIKHQNLTHLDYIEGLLRKYQS